MIGRDEVRDFSDLKASIGVRGKEPTAHTGVRANQLRARDMGNDHTTPAETDPRWARILARDKSSDGLFWYSVATTGVYCRPSCPSRHANRAHVTLHATLAEAQATGYRPCKRCNPDGPSRDASHSAIVARACQMIAGEAPPKLADLAAACGLSPGYFHRLFRAATGLTPRAFAAGLRAGRLRAELDGAGPTKGQTVTEAIYAAGFNSSGRFYEQADAILGMAPARYKAGGVGETMHFAIGQASLGAILVASSAKGVVAILLGDDPDALARELQDRFPHATLIGADAGYEAHVAQVVALVFSNAYGRRCARSAPARPCRTANWRCASARPNRPALSPAPAPPTTSPSPSRAIAWYGAMARSRAMRGALSANAPCCCAKGWINRPSRGFHSAPAMPPPPLPDHPPANRATATIRPSSTWQDPPWRWPGQTSPGQWRLIAFAAG